MFKRTYILFCLILVSWSAYTQATKKTRIFEVYLDDKKTGEYKVEQIIDGNRVTFKTFSNFVVSFGFKFKIQQQSEVVFENGHLLRSQSNFYRNDKPYKSLHVEKVNTRYKTVNQDGQVKYITEPITYSSSFFYFEFPNVPLTFSESEGGFKFVKSTLADGFEVLTVRSDHNADPTYFYYKNKKLVKVKVHYAFTNFELRAVN